MIYTLARYRTHRPAPPFTLGGQFAGDSNTPYLRDASTVIALTGEPGAWSDLSDGDLVEVEVSAVNAASLRIKGARVVKRRRSGFILPHRPRAAEFAAFVRAVRSFFLKRGLSEIHSPSLVRCPGLEPSLEPFQTEVTRGRSAVTAYLPTSPEISLKKALASNHTDLFEIKACFRRGEFSDHHAQEFLMLEWYRAFADLELIVADLGLLVDDLAEAGLIDRAVIEMTTFAALFNEMCDFELTPITTRDELLNLARGLGLETRADDSFADLFHRVMVDRIEPILSRRGPIIVRDFPPTLSALAKINAAGWGDRFEFYWRGLEIANAFNEVDDATEQTERWHAELTERQRLGTTTLPIDDELISALEGGSPPAGGIALGLERLFMAGNQIARIQDLRLFDELRP